MHCIAPAEPGDNAVAPVGADPVTRAERRWLPAFAGTTDIFGSLWPEFLPDEQVFEKSPRFSLESPGFWTYPRLICTQPPQRPLPRGAQESVVFAVPSWKRRFR